MSGFRFTFENENQQTLEDTIEETKCLDSEDAVSHSNKSCCCNSSFSQSCPEPSDVTINKTVIQIDESELRCAIENVTIVAQQGTLAHKPISGTCVRLYCNGVLQEPGAGGYYTVDGRIITLLCPPHPDDNHVAVYEYLASGGSTDPISRVGVVEAWAGLPAAIPTGSLLVDGRTIGAATSAATLAGEQYRALYDIIGSAYTTPAVTPDFDGNVVVNLPSITDVFQNTTPTLVQLNAFIWYLEAT